MQQHLTIVSSEGNVRRARPCQDNIPPTKTQRNKMLHLIQTHIKENNPVPPLSLEELRSHVDHILRIVRTEEKYRNYLAVLVNNEVWREHLAGIPYERRLLLLPQCLRSQDQCQGTLDDFGVVCSHCGNCIIHDLQTEAEKLGYMVMIAEGSPVVMSLIATGKIEAVVGVSCLSVLERVFPYMEAAAFPGMAIPLLQEGCADTACDMDWLWDAIYLTSDDVTRRLDLESLRNRVNSWFTQKSLEAILGRKNDQTKVIAWDWLAKSGKRCRPFLVACAFQAFQKNPELPLPTGLKKIAIAVECFHKASLIHDDIEDGDAIRYGEKTLHEQYGTAIALNVGDFLLGQGYSLLAESDARDEQKIALLQEAARGHRDLCVGQGAELFWTRAPHPLTLTQLTQIFRQKTAPAFNVALQMGTIYAGAGKGLAPVLKAYSDALGIAYQINDDLDDWQELAGPSDFVAQRPSFLLSLAYDQSNANQRQLLESYWKYPARRSVKAEKLHAILEELEIEAMARGLLEYYKMQAIRALNSLDNANLKGLLRLVISNIFNDDKVMGCCNDYQAGNAPERQRGGKSAR